MLLLLNDPSKLMKNYNSNSTDKKTVLDQYIHLGDVKLVYFKVSCAEKCSGKMVNTNHRLMAVFMEIGPPVDKQLGLSGTGMGMSM